MAEDLGGVWRTVGGRRIFIKDGQDLKSAMKASGKFKTNKEKEEDAKIGEDVEKSTKMVEERMSNEIKPFKKEELDEKVIKERGGLTDQEAKECVSVANEVYATAERNEPQITKDVVDSVKQVGGNMYGLDFRMKQPSSLAGKIGVDAKTDGISFKDAGANIKDAVRYTAIIDEKNFT